MPPLFERKLRFSDAVYAIDRTPKSLRKWLQNPDVVLFSDEAETQGWREFSCADIALLAVMGRAVDYGFGVVEANRLAIRVIQFFPQVLQYKDLPPGALAAVFANRTLFVWRDGEGWNLRLMDNWKGGKVPVDTYLGIDVEMLLLRAFERAEESSSDGREPEEEDSADNADRPS